MCFVGFIMDSHRTSSRVSVKQTISLVCSKVRLGILAGLLLALSVSAVNDWVKGGTLRPNRPAPSLAIDSSPLEREGTSVVSFAPVVQQAAPSVVKVYTSATSSRESTRWQQNPMERFFGFPGWDAPNPPQTPQTREGLGSGVIVSPEGYILTNYHVIKGADEVKVVISPDEVTHVAEVVGGDPKSDVAVLKIDAEGLRPMDLGDSDQILVGDLVLAIGNPFGVGQTVTMGMVSAKGRADMGLEYEDFIQTDAAINPGNSGGALVDAKGRLMGINTAILSRSGGNMGIGFAIPINLAKSVMESLIANGEVIRGYLGINIQDLRPEMASYFNLDEKQGALVADVVPDSPAQVSGLQPGDVVMVFDGKPVLGSRELKLMVGSSQPGVVYEVKVLRQGKELLLGVELGQLGEPFLQKASHSSQGNEQVWLKDLELEPLNRALKSQYGVPQSVDGLVIVAVRQGSLAWNAGLRPGNVVREINRTAVMEMADLRQLDFDGPSVLLRLWVDGAHVFRVITLNEQG